MMYEIVVRGRVRGSLLHALEGFTVVPNGPRVTRFRGHVKDQAGLQRVLREISDCNLALTSVRCLDGANDHGP